MEGAWRAHDINLHIVKNITQEQLIIKKYPTLTNSDPSKAANAIYSSKVVVGVQSGHWTPRAMLLLAQMLLLL